jgi:hypothetical protein
VIFELVKNVSFDLVTRCQRMNLFQIAIVRSSVECASKCSISMGCSAFRFNEVSKICELASADFLKTSLQAGNETISVLTQRKPCET